MDEYTSTQSFYKKAKTVLSPDVFSFIDGGSLDELALKRNRETFSKVLISPRVLRGVNKSTTQVKLFDHTHSAPVLIAPAAYQSLLSSKGELDMLEAANQFNTTMILSMFSSIDYTLIARNKKVPVWSQMYFLKDRGINKNFIQWMEELNFDALVVTVDAPVYAKKERERSQPLRFPENTSFPHLKKIGIPFEECLKTKRHLSTLLDHSISWDDLDWLAGVTKLPIILKGIIDPRDTEIALTYPNVKGIVISNHGGRQLDSSIAPLEVMHKHREKAGNKVKLFLDGGIARGSDIFKALALGADATLTGRTALWALSIGGSAGVFHALSILQQELQETMILSGCSTIKDITSDYLACKGDT
ncbi:alpha-hydroxy acid oxidase [Legionella hackeliae]|uniref:Putative Hydroxyacid oxidase n=1 Tax=Legionella hackeliae TaxID=449 RepID=A0A0A8UQ43_LEGHA|nr:alpha-hydroxy acid oxidase [Legionella hackeliae]KTD10107.1 FMN-dependent dehydrogenase [Legionella hackeliae]CEK09596.1 putative Hydroxyacid oxidase [Legionella hackeliae]STX49507.1 FMN-dependent dehydrogenase [Legionella hackeliae]